MKKSIVLLAALFFLSFSIFISSCNHEEEPVQEQNDTTTANEKSVEDVTYATEYYNDVISDVLIKTDENDGSKSKAYLDCPTVTLEPTIGYPKTLTIDYGDGCSNYGATKKGKITAEISDRLRQEGTTVSITFTNFYIDTIQLSGTVSITIDSVDLINQIIYFSTNFNNCSLTMPSGSISLSGNLSFVWNINTITDYTDDTFEIASGSLSGTNRDGKSFTATIQESLLFTAECMTITKGIIKVETSDTSYPATIDFGDGTCDHIATVSTTIVITTPTGQTYTKTITYEITIP
jgi:hypothetical protein